MEREGSREIIFIIGMLESKIEPKIIIPNMIPKTHFSTDFIMP
jgi:hypothetical protein